MDFLRTNIFRARTHLSRQLMYTFEDAQTSTVRSIPATLFDERGQSTREFAQVLTIIAAAILVGASGGIWIAGDSAVNLKLNKVVQTVGHYIDRSDSRESAKATAKPEVPPETKAPEAPALNPAQHAAPGQQTQKRPVAGGLLSLDSVRYSYQQGVTTIDIDLGTSTLVQAARLHDPERIFFDLKNAQQADGSVPKQEQQVENIDDTVLSSLRLAPRGSGEVRIVLDVKQYCEFTYKQLAQPTPRLIIELKSSTPASPAHN